MIDFLIYLISLIMVFNIFDDIYEEQINYYIDDFLDNYIDDN